MFEIGVAVIADEGDDVVVVVIDDNFVRADGEETAESKIRT